MKRTMDTGSVERILRSALTEKSQARERLQTTRWSDAVDEAQWSEDAAVAIRELDVTWTRQQQARVALNQLKAGRYGECQSCGRFIGVARLEALPWAMQCVQCAAIRERLSPVHAAEADDRSVQWLHDFSDAA